ncbi:hypothetical protein LshimejAT787_1203640 [Lyophyllum shimeji]|uniref:F-box domain-containing protein n=1 Tax=Lyophyllum shimeji TaxID=47721 RepID=A0A9P3PU38_LYOSH|nr:hypothetical protein LshimejAT787_1203640 [Lyophyllum shimeji]
MFDHSQIPPEVFAAVFEIGILTWDIQFLPPLRLVSKAWNDIIMTTPHLWGIITIHKDTDFRRTEYQIIRAKESPLAISVQARMNMPPYKIIRMLVSLARNWRCAEVSIRLLVRCRWSDLRGSLETLKLTSTGMQHILPENFFNLDDEPAFRRPPRLRSLTAVGLSKEWVLPLLSPAITYFELCHRDESVVTHQLADTLTYLQKTPNVSDLKLDGVRHVVDRDLPADFQRPVRLAKLITLKLDGVLYPSTLLCKLSAPVLQTLAVHRAPVQYEDEYGVYGRAYERRLLHPDLQPLSPFFTQWSDGAFLPEKLHTLVLEDCLQVQDVAFLIGWLARLPNLVRLTLWDDAIAPAAEDEEETNVIRALASPDGARRHAGGGGWLCPALMQLRIATDLRVADLVPLARARGGRYVQPNSAAVPPKRLRYLEAPLCPCGSEEEIELLRGLVDEVRCVCLSCQFELAL